MYFRSFKSIETLKLDSYRVVYSVLTDSLKFLMTSFRHRSRRWIWQMGARLFSWGLKSIRSTSGISRFDFVNVYIDHLCLNMEQLQNVTTMRVKTSMIISFIKLMPVFAERDEDSGGRSWGVGVLLPRQTAERNTEPQNMDHQLHFPSYLLQGLEIRCGDEAF